MKNRFLRQAVIDKMKEVSVETLSKTKNTIRNYIVCMGRSYTVYFEEIHVGFNSDNHYKTIKMLVNYNKNNLIYKILLDDRKFK